MASLNDFYNAKTIVATWTQLKGSKDATNFYKPLEKWFPYQTTNEMDITLGRGYKNQNVSMDLCAYDTNARIRGLQAISTDSREIPYFKNSVLFTEKDRRNILTAIKLHANNQTIISALSQHTKNVIDVLLNGADVVAERYRAQLLQFGSVTVSTSSSAISKNSLSIDYDMSGEWASNNVRLWSANPSNGTTDIVADLMEVLNEYIQVNGTAPATMIMTGSTFIAICNDTRLNKLLDTQKFDSLEEVLQKKTKVPITILLNNAKYRPDFGEDEVPYWNQDVVSIVPNTALGNIMCGLTPVQYDDMFAKVSRDTANTKENFSILCRHIDDPIQTETIGSACLLPQFSMMDKVFVIRPS